MRLRSSATSPPPPLHSVQTQTCRTPGHLRSITRQHAASGDTSRRQSQRNCHATVRECARLVQTPEHNTGLRDFQSGPCTCSQRSPLNIYLLCPSKPLKAWVSITEIRKVLDGETGWCERMVRKMVWNGDYGMMSVLSMQMIDGLRRWSGKLESPLCISPLGCVPTYLEEANKSSGRENSKASKEKHDCTGKNSTGDFSTVVRNRFHAFIFAHSGTKFRYLHTLYANSKTLSKGSCIPW
jgi:hypothetical protein